MWHHQNISVNHVLFKGLSSTQIWPTSQKYNALPEYACVIVDEFDAARKFYDLISTISFEINTVGKKGKIIIIIGVGSLWSQKYVCSSHAMFEFQSCCQPSQVYNGLTEIVETTERCYYWSTLMCIFPIMGCSIYAESTTKRIFYIYIEKKSTSRVANIVHQVFSEYDMRFGKTKFLE